jgi:hypothetical protein
MRRGKEAKAKRWLVLSAGVARLGRFRKKVSKEQCEHSLALTEKTRLQYWAHYSIVLSDGADRIKGRLQKERTARRGIVVFV